MKKTKNLERKNRRKENVVLIQFDISGFTSYSSYHESRGEEDIVFDLTDRIIDDGIILIKEYGGNPRNPTGDGYISTFPPSECEAALETALELHRLAEELRKAEDSPKRDLYLKVALHKQMTLFKRFKGERKYTPFGTASSTVGRIEQYARPGETLASEPVIETVRDRFALEKMPGVYLKGLGHHNTIYRVLGKAVNDQLYKQ